MGFQAPWVAKNAARSAGTRRTPASAEAPHIASDERGSLEPRARSMYRVAAPAAMRERTSNEVFIDVPSAAPTATPKRKNRDRVGGPVRRMAMAAIQSTVQSTSVRYSTEPSMKSGTSAQRATARNAARMENRFRPMIQARASASA